MPTILKANIESLDGVEEHFHELYTEQPDGKYLLTGVDGFKTLEDFNKVDKSLKASRADNLALKNKYAVLGDRAPDEILADLDRIPELEAMAGDKTDDEKIAKLVEAKVATQVQQYERKLAQTERERDEALAIAGTYKEKINVSTVESAVRSLSKGKLREEAIDDAVFYAQAMLNVNDEGKAVTNGKGNFVEGLSVEEWLTDMIATKPLWQPENTTGGSKTVVTGVKGINNNPWTAENWNRTQQAEIIEADQVKAEQLAKKAGVAIYASGPKKD